MKITNFLIQKSYTFDIYIIGKLWRFQKCIYSMPEKPEKKVSHNQKKSLSLVFHLEIFQCNIIFI